MTDTANADSSGEDEDVLELVVLLAQLYRFTRSQCIAHSKG